jgi:hypothetical protein
MPENRNHGQGSIKKSGNNKANPITTLKDVRDIISILKGEPRNSLLFVIGVNSWLRIGTLLILKVGDVRRLEIGDKHFFYEPDSQNPKYLEINRSIYNELKKYLKDTTLKDGDHLFKSRKGKGHLTIQSVNRLVTRWTKTIGLNGYYGCESLRKTFGYIQRIEFGVGFDILCKRFNQQSPAKMATFLGIPKEKPVTILNNKVG